MFLSLHIYSCETEAFTWTNCPLPCPIRVKWMKCNQLILTSIYANELINKTMCPNKVIMRQVIVIVGAVYNKLPVRYTVHVLFRGFISHGVVSMTSWDSDYLRHFDILIYMSNITSWNNWWKPITLLFNMIHDVYILCVNWYLPAYTLLTFVVFFVHWYI